MIREAQSVLEGHPPVIQRGPISLKPNLETISEATSTMERGISLHSFDSMLYEGPPLREIINRPLAAMYYGDEIPNIEESNVGNVNKQVEELGSLICSQPFSIVDFTSRKTLEVDNASLPEDMQTVASQNEIC